MARLHFCRKIIILLYLICGSDASSLSGSVGIARDLEVQNVHVALFKINLDAESGLTKRRLLGAESLLPLRRPPADFVVHANRKHRDSNLLPWDYTFTDVPDGNYSVVAFEPAAEDMGSWLDFAPPRRQALGFYRDQDGCAAESFSDTVCSKIVTVSGRAHVQNIDVTLEAPHLIPESATTTNGALRRLSGVRASVLHVKGTAYERGFAHGILLAPQIIDMVNYFLIEDMVRSNTFYSERFLPALEKLAHLTPQFTKGLYGMLAGMRASNHSMKTTLGRDIVFLDLVALNTYADAPAWTSSAASTPKSACTQFVFWGDAVSIDLSGGTLAGRNMDGENDIRKLTVNNLIVHAVEPTEEGSQRYVHVMWPGFLGASSGFNEKGRYLMENAGCSPPGKAAQQSPLQRDMISSLLSDKTLNPTAGPQEMESAILSHRSEAGGSCTAGGIMVSAEPFNMSENKHSAGYIYECDRSGGAMRLPGAFPPVVEQGVMATNHYFLYNTAPGHEQMCNGVPSTFSSLARYFAGKNKVESWSRSKPLKVGVAEIQELLKVVAHGTTEHSVIFLPNAMTFYLAVASPNGVWDAPYTSWYEFSFNAMFEELDISRRILFF